MELVYAFLGCVFIFGLLSLFIVVFEKIVEWPLRYYFPTACFVAFPTLGLVIGTVVFIFSCLGSFFCP